VTDISHLRHELRTPVNAVLGYSEMLLEDAPAHQEALEATIRSARDILAAIDTRLSPTTSAFTQRDLDALRRAIEPHQMRILGAVAALRRAEGIAAMAADLVRIETAATRLLTVGFPEAVDTPTQILDVPTMIAAAPITAHTLTATEATPGAPFRILVVDDVADNRAVLERRLEREGHIVECAGNGREALDQILERRYDLILLDIMMPEVDGFEVLRRLKLSADTRDIPVIMISALDDLDSVVRCIEQGAEDHLTKPFEPVLLRARINASLDKKRLRDREQEYLREVKAIAAAASSVEEGRYESAALARTALRGDELGRLARVFDGMAAEVKAREDRLHKQVAGLRQEIESVRRRADVTETGDVRLPAGHALAGRYEIEELVGVGAMGTVYRARDRELTETVAVKVLRPELLSDRTVLERFKAEVRLARRISHPSVVRTHDVGESGGVHYLTMEYVEGITARALLDSRGKLGVAAVLALAGQLTRALVAAHAQGVIHRDIKPQNLLLDGQGTLKVMDFGVSRLAGQAGGAGEAGLLIGTPDYMAPEQLLGEDIDERADLYATGVVLFECLTGLLPFHAETLVAKIAKVLGEDAPSLIVVDSTIPSALSTLVTRLLSRQRDARPASAQELLRLLDQVGA
jgi:CheY-like chemotaxis protein/tRNA A-37 threonylcarbamoyl transferase component Bud32